MTSYFIGGVNDEINLKIKSVELRYKTFGKNVIQLQGTLLTHFI